MIVTPRSAVPSAESSGRKLKESQRGNLSRKKSQMKDSIENTDDKSSKRSRPWAPSNNYLQNSKNARKHNLPGARPRKSQWKFQMMMLNFGLFKAAVEFNLQD